MATALQGDASWPRPIALMSSQGPAGRRFWRPAICRSPSPALAKYACASAPAALARPISSCSPANIVSRRSCRLSAATRSRAKSRRSATASRDFTSASASPRSRSMAALPRRSRARRATLYPYRMAFPTSRPLAAWQMIHRVAKVKAGATALVTAAGGGVGTALLQLLKLEGVKAYGTASSGKHELIRKLGGIPLDYRAGAIDRLVRAHEGRGVDAAFDAIGGANIASCVRAVRPGGTVVGYGFVAASSALSQARMFFDVFIGSRLRGRRGTFYGVSLLYRKNPQPFLEDLPKILALVASRKIEPVIAEVAPLADVRQALERLASGNLAGKIVLTCDETPRV